MVYREKHRDNYTKIDNSLFKKNIQKVVKNTIFYFSSNFIKPL